jgi:hypothetical protein
VSTARRSGLDSVTIAELAEIMRFSATVADALTQLSPSLVRRAGLLPLAELLDVVDRWATTDPTAGENP